MKLNFFIFLLLSISNVVYADDNYHSASREIKKFVYANGEPHSLESIYNVNAPDDGFDSFYIYSLVKSDILFPRGNYKIYPFVYSDEKERKLSGDNYSRCNISIEYNGNVSIPNRRYKSGGSEDFSPCIGFESSYKIINNKTDDVAWIIMDVVYKNATLDIEKTKEVYFLLKDKGRVCYSEKATELINKNKISYKIKLTEHDYDECNSIK